MNQITTNDQNTSQAQPEIKNPFAKANFTPAASLQNSAETQSIHDIEQHIRTQPFVLSNAQPLEMGKESNIAMNGVWSVRNGSDITCITPISQGLPETPTYRFTGRAHFTGTMESTLAEDPHPTNVGNIPFYITGIFSTASMGSSTTASNTEKVVELPESRRPSRTKQKSGSEYSMAS